MQLGKFANLLNEGKGGSEHGKGMDDIRRVTSNGIRRQCCK